ncbi:probable aspartyl protease At4g16563 [Elaeis guineensis]|uniref:probable aspartyl protease At4g16563 n=1 Tax=Elaeis guineensis var. tenera TaxID=51953 RepID=UPI003C6CD3EF
MASTPPFLLCSLLFSATLFYFQLLPLSASSQSDQLILLPLTHSLTHSDSPNATIHHLLKTSSLRSAARHRRHRHQQRAREVSLPLSSGSDYTLSLSVGPPDSPTTVQLYMDTGSDLVWFPCSPFECILCEGKEIPSTSPSPPPSPPAGSHLVSCRSAACAAAHSAVAASSSSSSDLCAIAGCPLEVIETDDSCAAHPCPRFYYAYGDGSLVARLRRGSLSVGPLRLPGFIFACAHSALAEPVGVAGFGRAGPLSLPSQLAALSPSLAARFSYCLVSHSFRPDRLLRPSPLILGRSLPTAGPSEPDSPFVYTPLLPNPKHPYFYSVALLALSVGPTRIPASSILSTIDRNGNGGMVVDSGTTFTMLPAETHSSLAAEFDRQMVRAGFDRTVRAESETGLRPCYNWGSDRNASRRVPGLALHFSGDASVALPRRNYFMGFVSGGKRVGCLMVMSGGDGEGEEDYGGPAGTLGNFQQQGFEVVYDLEGKRVGFARRQCAALWDSLSRG